MTTGDTPENQELSRRDLLKRAGKAAAATLLAGAFTHPLGKTAKANPLDEIEQDAIRYGVVPETVISSEYRFPDGAKTNELHKFAGGAAAVPASLGYDFTAGPDRGIKANAGDILLSAQKMLRQKADYVNEVNSLVKQGKKAAYPTIPQMTSASVLKVPAGKTFDVTIIKQTVQPPRNANEGILRLQGGEENPYLLQAQHVYFFSDAPEQPLRLKIHDIDEAFNFGVDKPYALDSLTPRLWIGNKDVILDLTKQNLFIEKRGARPQPILLPLGAVRDIEPTSESWKSKVETARRTSRPRPRHVTLELTRDQFHKLGAEGMEAWMNATLGPRAHDEQAPEERPKNSLPGRLTIDIAGSNLKPLELVQTDSSQKISDKLEIWRVQNAQPRIPKAGGGQEEWQKKIDRPADPAKGVRP